MISSPAVFALDQRGDEAAGALACAGCGGFFLFLFAGALALQIGLLVWVARDAKARGMDSAVIWMLFVFFVPLLGLLVYLFSRPKGSLVPCPKCGNKRLEASARCPHCGND
jgi:phospholipase D-like protein